MGSAKPLYLFVIVFAFIYLINFRSDALRLPSTSAEGEVQETRGLSTPSLVLVNNELIKRQKLRIRRIEYEIDDYPGSGANDRHSP